MSQRVRELVKDARSDIRLRSWSLVVCTTQEEGTPRSRSRCRTVQATAGPHVSLAKWRVTLTGSGDTASSRAFHTGLLLYSSSPPPLPLLCPSSLLLCPSSALLPPRDPTEPHALEAALKDEARPLPRPLPVELGLPVGATAGKRVSHRSRSAASAARSLVCLPSLPPSTRTCRGDKQVT